MEYKAYFIVWLLYQGEQPQKYNVTKKFELFESVKYTHTSIKSKLFS